MKYNKVTSKKLNTPIFDSIAHAALYIVSKLSGVYRVLGPVMHSPTKRTSCDKRLLDTWYDHMVYCWLTWLWSSCLLFSSHLTVSVLSYSLQCGGWGDSDRGDQPHCQVSQCIGRCQSRTTNNRPVYRPRDHVTTDNRPVYRPGDHVTTDNRPIYRPRDGVTSREHLKLQTICLMVSSPPVIWLSF